MSKEETEMAQMDIGEILKYLPHRYPMLLIDRVVEVAFWNTIRGSDNQAAIRAYVDKYPDGQFAPVARASLERMTK